MNVGFPGVDTTPQADGLEDFNRNSEHDDVILGHVPYETEPESMTFIRRLITVVVSIGLLAIVLAAIYFLGGGHDLG